MSNEITPLLTDEQADQECSGDFDTPSDIQVIVKVFNEVVHSNQEQKIKPRNDVVKLLRIFAGKELPEEVYTTAYFVDIADRLNNDTQKYNAKRALNLYLRTAYPKYNEEGDAISFEYFTNQLTDFPMINDYVSKRLDTALSEDNPAYHDALHFSKEATIPNDIWLNGQYSPDLRSLAELAKNVNAETILVKAAQAYCELLRDDLPQVECMRIIGAIETTYQPLLETWGLDAFGALLADLVNRKRLILGGREDLVKKASEMIEEFGDKAELEQFMEEITTSLVDNSDIEHITNYKSGVDSYFIFHVGSIGSGEDEQFVNGVTRRKSSGSLARKLYNAEKKEQCDDRIPADYFASTMICETKEQVAQAIVNVTRRIRQNNAIEYYPALSRNESFHAKGSKEFKNLIREALAEIGITNEEIDFGPETTNFMVAKVTIAINYPHDGKVSKVPLEIQFVDPETRKAGRIGAESHILFKLAKYATLSEANKQYIKSGEALKDLEDIHERKQHMKKNSKESNPRSAERGAILRPDIQRCEFTIDQWRVLSGQLAERALVLADQELWQ